MPRRGVERSGPDVRFAAMTDHRTRGNALNSRADFLRRLSYYAIGVAIGFAILGMLRAKSQAEARQREAERQRLMNAPPGPSVPTPTTGETSGAKDTRPAER